MNITKAHHTTDVSRLIINIILSFLLLSFMFTIPIPSTSAMNTTIYVDDSNVEGPWEGSREHPYLRIQDGIDHAASGDIVFVFSGVYTEDLWILEKSVSLIGEDRNTTIIVGNEKHSLLTIVSHDVVVSDFMIQGGIQGVHIENSNSVLLHHNKILDNSYGIEIQGSTSVFIHTNTFSQSILSGIHLFTSVEQESENTTISHNMITDSHIGLEILSGGSHHVHHNFFLNNSVGINLFYSGATDVIIEYNQIIYNEEGILFNTGAFQTPYQVRYNDIAYNTQYGIISYINPLFPSPAVTPLSRIYQNNICNNTEQSYVDIVIDGYLDIFFVFLGRYTIFSTNYWGQPHKIVYTIPGHLAVFFGIPPKLLVQTELIWGYDLHPSEKCFRISLSSMNK